MYLTVFDMRIMVADEGGLFSVMLGVISILVICYYIKSHYPIWANKNLQLTGTEK